MCGILTHMKICNVCKEERPVSDFSKNARYKDGLLKQCRRCNTERVKAYYKKNPEKTRRLHRHNLSQEKFEEMSRFGCNICGSPDNLRVDHDHSCCSGNYSCGKCVRGVLCQKHNSGLGSFNDSKEMLEKAIQYLNKLS